MDTKKSDEIPVTKKMLDETRGELKSDIASVKLEMKAGFSEVKSEIKELTSAVHRALALNEEQNARNKYVLDGYQSLHDLFSKNTDETNERVSSIEKTISKMNSTN